MKAEPRRLLRRRVAQSVGVLPGAIMLLPGLALAQQPDPHAHHHAAAAAQEARPDTSPGGRALAADRIVQNGVTVEFTLNAGRGPAGEALPVTEGREFTVGFRIADTAGAPVTGGRPPIVWIDTRQQTEPTLAEGCRDKIGTYAEGALKARPAVDLNSYYVLALSKAPVVVVLDPILGFGRTKLRTTVRLPAPGVDWVATEDDRTLLVTIPSAGQVAVIDTDAWTVVDSIEAGQSPTRIFFQPDRRAVLVTNEPDSATLGGVTVIDPVTRKVRGHVRTGAGPHVVAFTDDGRLAFVASRMSGTVSVVDAATLAVVKRLQTGPRPVDLAYSSATGAMYVAHALDGVIAAVDAQSLEVTARIATKPGIYTIRFAPDAGAGGHAHGGDQAPSRTGKLGFITNPVEQSVYVIDAEKRQVLATRQVPGGPDQVMFTPSFAYVRAANAADVHLIPLTDPAAPPDGKHDLFAAGSVAPGAVGPGRLGTTLVSAPDMPEAIYALNATERMIYYFHYMEGMPIPSGGLTTYGFEPTTIRVVRKSLRQREPGEYTATVKLNRAGEYEAVFYLPDQHVVHCFPMTAAKNAELREGKIALRVESLVKKGLRVGENVLRLRLVDDNASAPLDGIPDVTLWASSPAGWQQRVPARPLGEGVYEASLSIPSTGVYYVSVAAPSRKITPVRRSPLVFHVTDEAGDGR